MKQFDRKAKCPKCGHDDVGVSFCGRDNWCMADNATNWRAGEHLDRRCRRCGFSWKEKCLDHEARCGVATPEADTEGADERAT